MTEQPSVFGTNKERTDYVYYELISMLEARDQTYPQFNDRNLIDFIDDSRKRVNGYAPGKDEYDPPKEAWQNNTFNPVTCNKLKAIAASVAATAPESKVVAINKQDQIDLEAARMLTGLKKYSRLNENTSMNHLFDVWNTLSDGTLVKYEGYQKTKKKVRVVTSFNQVDGIAEFKEEEKIIEDKCIELTVPIDQFYIKDFSIFDIQEQPAVAWIRYLNKAELAAEFSHHKNYKKILHNTKQAKKEQSAGGFSDTEKSKYNNRWLERSRGKRDYEVVQFYEKDSDLYRVVCNGAPLIDTPLLWGKTKKKYPFAKGIFEPFAGGEFFFGNAIGAALQFGQDVQNTLWNMMIDKVYRSIVKPRIIGITNQDAFEREEEDYDWSANIYVNDVNQYKEMPIEGVNQSELAMFDLVKREVDLASVDQVQQGVSGSGVTATEIRTANAMARQKRGIFFTLLEDLRLQQDKLRIINIIANYTIPKIEKIEGGTDQKSFRTFAFPDEMQDGEGGIREIRFVEDKKSVPSQKTQDEEMQKLNKKGTYTELEIYPSDYLDDYLFDVAIISESLHAVDKAENIADVTQLAQALMVLNPDLWMANKDDFTKRRLLPAYGENIENFKLPNPMQGMPPPGAEGGAPAEGGGGKPQGSPQQAGQAALPAFLDANKLQQQ